MARGPTGPNHDEDTLMRPPIYAIDGKYIHAVCPRCHPKATACTCPQVQCSTQGRMELRDLPNGGANACALYARLLNPIGMSPSSRDTVTVSRTSTTAAEASVANEASE